MLARRPGQGSIWQVLVDAFRRGVEGTLPRRDAYFVGSDAFGGIRCHRRVLTGTLTKAGVAGASRRAVGGAYGGFGRRRGVWLFCIRRWPPAAPGRLRGYFDCALSLVRADGVPRLYRGLAPSLLRAAPSAAPVGVTFNWLLGGRAW